MTNTTPGRGQVWIMCSFSNFLWIGLNRTLGLSNICIVQTNITDNTSGQICTPPIAATYLEECTRDQGQLSTILIAEVGQIRIRLRLRRLPLRFRQEIPQVRPRLLRLRLRRLPLRLRQAGPEVKILPEIEELPLRLRVWWVPLRFREEMSSSCFTPILSDKMKTRLSMVV